MTFRTDSYVRFGAKERLLTNVTDHSTKVCRPICVNITKTCPCNIQRVSEL